MKEPFSIYKAQCSECMFWVEDPEFCDIGKCFRHAPSPYRERCSDEENPEDTTITWPTTVAMNFCGEWERRS